MSADNSPSHSNDDKEPTKTFACPPNDTRLSPNTPTDLTISTAWQDFRVHKAIVCPQSGIFAAECKEQSQPQYENFGLTKDTIIETDIENDKLDVVLEYLYTASYNDEHLMHRADEISPTLPMEFNIEIFFAAHYLDIPSLTALAATKFNSRADEFASKDDFCAAVRIMHDAYDSVRDEDDECKALFRKMATVAADHALDMLHVELAIGPVNLEDAKTPFRSLMRDYQSFAEDVLVRTIARCQALQWRESQSQTRACDECGARFCVLRQESPGAIPGFCPYCKGETSALQSI